MPKSTDDVTGEEVNDEDDADQFAFMQIYPEDSTMHTGRKFRRVFAYFIYFWH